MQSVLVFLSLSVLAAAGNRTDVAEPKSDAVAKKPLPSLPGWHCKEKMYCLKQKGKELKRIEVPGTWDERPQPPITWCQQKCVDYGKECWMVDIEAFDGDFKTNMSICILYNYKESNNWMTDGCTKDKQWMTCSHKPEVDESKAEDHSVAELKTIDDSVVDSKAEEDSVADSRSSDITLETSVGRSRPSTLKGWQCKGGLRCLNGKPLKTFTADEMPLWKFADCEDACQKTDGCVSVDVQWWYYDDFGYKVNTCVLYDIHNVQSFKFCTKASGWTTCMHNGKRQLHIDELTKAGEFGSASLII